MPLIPTNFITGFLGVGKTTAVIDLLKHKTSGERWAVLVNEYGDVSIDGAMIEGSSPDGVTVREVGGGCVCCASAPYLPVALHFLLLDAKPDRLIIETTGLGHPARLLDTLRTNYADRLDVRAVLGIVDPADFAKSEMRDNPVFIDQIQLADVVVMNKLDTATPELVAYFQKWANGLFPPKLLIAGTTYGRLDTAWLNLTANDERLPLYPEAHGHEHEHDPVADASGSSGTPVTDAPGSPETTPVADAPGSPGTHKLLSLASRESQRPENPTPGSPRHYPSPPGIRPACCGWLFTPDDVFDEGKLLGLLGRTQGITRLKGVFRLTDEWAMVNRAGTAVSVAPTAYRRDSRLEVFAEGLDWLVFEQGLLDCLVIR